MKVGLGGSIFSRPQEAGLPLMVQWLRLCALNAGGPGSIPGQGTRSRMPPLRVCMLQLKIPHATIRMEDPAALRPGTAK